MTDLPALLGRLRAATGPDRTLDADICVSLGYVEMRRGAINVRLHSSSLNSLRFDVPEDNPFGEFPHYGGSCPAPALTASIDAAVSLVERMLPGAALDLTIERSHSTASIWREGKDPETRSGKTAPLAILIATIEALMAREGRL